MALIRVSARFDCVARAQASQAGRRGYPPSVRARHNVFMRTIMGAARRLGFASKLCGAATVCALAFAVASHAAQRERAAMGEAALRFLATLDDAQLSRVLIDFDDAARGDWHYVPRERPGVRLGELDEKARAAAQELFAAALSARGLEKLEGVLALEALLRELASAGGRTPPSWRDPGNYSLCLFGDPASAEPWGWRIEGHHLSLSFTLAGDDVAVTPHFFGAEPTRADVPGRKDLRVLGAEEDLALELLQSFDDAQRALALRAGEPPQDILFGPGGDPFEIEPAGIAWQELSPQQRELLERLVGEVIGNLEPALAADARQRLDEEGHERLHFVWMGAASIDAPHYWRVQGQRSVIELDNVQSGGHHAHLVWRDLERDFGADLLRRHRAAEHDGR